MKPIFTAGTVLAVLHYVIALMMILVGLMEVSQDEINKMYAAALFVGAFGALAVGVVIQLLISMAGDVERILRLTAEKR